jgi:hypothetical protein
VAVELAKLDAEIKKYDIEEMKSDIVLKMNTIFTDLGRSQKALVREENRNMRQLDKVEHMQKAIAEDT